MSNNYEKKAIQYIQARKRRKKRRRAVAALAALVVMLTGYTLVTPAVTMQGETYCGYEEHTAHDRACYEPEGTLLCGCAGEGHQHTESCFGEQTVLICQLTETDSHEHGELCFCEEDFPVCGHDDPEHEHDADCYERRRVLICEEPEQEAHQHDESCYATERQLICEEHTHTEGCYEPDGDPDTLLCELPLHRHTLQCYSDPEADRESPAIREASFASVTLSGIWREDVLAIAETQLGYAESERNYMVQEDGISRKGYTRYGDWYGAPYADWCAIFCSFCLHYAGIDTAVIPAEASCEQWIGKLEPLGRYHAADGYVPQPGDLIFFDFDEQEEGADRKADHVGFVSEVIFDEAFDRPVELRTIEGNKGGRVVRDSYPADSSSILGYAELPESSDGIEMTALSAMRLSAAESSAVSLARVDMA